VRAFKVIDGPFQDFNGVVEDVKAEKGKLRVLISIFGRATPVELDFVPGRARLGIRGVRAGEKSHRRDQAPDSRWRRQSEPTVGPALGQRGVNIMEFCKTFNAQTQGQAGLIIPVIITVYRRSLVHLHHQDAACRGAPQARRRRRKGSGEPNR
jgi:hypothetical protein